MEILAVENLSFSYPLCNEKALDGVSFSVEKGDFVAVCGATGSGKSTLLRLLKKETAPAGELTGEVRYNGGCCSGGAGSIGFVMQRPEQQIVTDKVWHELAFGLENLNIPSGEIRRRVSEMACYFGIEEWFDKSVNELSGGQKQLLNLAGVMVMQPDVLLLDEPTAQLDPIAAQEFISTVSRLNRELSLTVIIVEHRLEDVLACANKLLVLENGGISDYADVRTVAQNLRSKPELLKGMPAAVRLYSRFDKTCVCPITVREGRDFIERGFKNSVRCVQGKPYVHSAAPALEFSDVFFRYSRGEPDVLRGLSFTVYEGEIFCILGGNGSGKSTALETAARLNKIYSGSVKVFGKKLGEYKNQSLYKGCLSMLPQDVQTVFLKNTVAEELADAGAVADSLPYDLSALYERHPYDLSGGQQQLVALAKVLASKPRLILLDEPTKGLDAHARGAIAEILKQIKASGMTVVIVTHDAEFAAECADRCAMFFRGEITSCDVPGGFFPSNSFYTTAASRITRGYYDGAITVDDVERLCRANLREEGERCL
ncbi:MAG: ATP-binding cassette domain-containing protein [Clostridiales bacterium]|nr:ATP-binding cassette domain-containing protein [Clostridiales bacterium]